MIGYSILYRAPIPTEALMMFKKPDWDHIRVFLALARTGSLRAAAQELGVSQPTLGRHLSALEDVVGVVLFDRLPEGLRMTDAGRDLRPRAEAMEEAAFAFHRQGDAISGIRDRQVRLTASAWSALFLAGQIDSKPDGLYLEIRQSDDTQLLTKREADFAVRHGLPLTGDFITKRLGTISCAIYATERLAYDMRGMGPDRVFANAPWICFSEEFDLYESQRWLLAHIDGNKPLFRAGNTAMLQNALRTGIGAGILPCFLGDSDPALARVSRPIETLDSDIWLIVHRDLRAAEGIKQATNWVADMYKRRVLQLSGARAYGGEGMELK